MDGPTPAISPENLYRSLGSGAAPLVIDVRRPGDFDADDRLIAGAIRHPPDELAHWRETLPPGRPVVVYCVEGAAVGEAAAAALAAAGHEAAYLAGGIRAWREAGRPTRRRVAATGRWVTRERPKVDRIACPWLISRFIDPEAEFLYVPSADVRDVALRRDAIPFDIEGAQFGHVGDRCSFDAFIDIFGLEDAALDRLALIVRGADTGKPALTPQSPGLLALSQGLSATIADDHAMLAHGMVVYDALYAWCRAAA